METTISTTLAVCYTLQFLSLFNLLNGLWQRKLSKLSPVYDSAKNVCDLPSKERIHNLSYKLLMAKIKNSLVPTSIGYSSHTFNELFRKEIVLVRKRNRMVDEIIHTVYNSDYGRERKIVIFGGFVRDYVSNYGATKFINFKDFDVKCKSPKIANSLVDILSEKFNIVIVNQSSCTCKQTRETVTVKHIPIICTSCYCSDCSHSRTKNRKNRKERTETKKEEFIFDLCVITLNITHMENPEISFSMDIVIDPSSFVKLRRYTKKYKITSDNPDFDVNQLYLDSDLETKSMVDSLSINTVEKNIREKVFTVFSNNNELFTEHQVNSRPYDYNTPWRSIKTDLLEYPVTMNPQCIYRSDLYIGSIGSTGSTGSIGSIESDHQYTDLDFATRGRKIRERIDKMKKKGWTCLTCPNGCSNPLCIFSPDVEYQNWIEARNKYNSDLAISRKIESEKRLVAKLHTLQNYIDNRPIGHLFHFQYTGKNRQEEVFEKKCKSVEIEKTKKHMRKFNMRASEKKYSQLKHSDLVKDRFVKK